MSDKLILVIDSEESVREVVEICLHYLGGWNVRSVGSLQAGLDTLKAEYPDAIVLDISSHQLNDWKVLQALKNHLPQPIPIILISTRAAWFSSQQLRDWEVAGAIAKPFNPNALVEQVAGMLGWHIEQTG